MLDLHVHLLGHLDREASPENIAEFLNQGQNMGLKQIGFADHDMYWENLNLDMIRKVALDYPHLQVRVGLEVDYLEGKEKQIKEIIDSYPFDFIIGSVHQIGDWCFDFPDEEARHRQWEADDLYRAYFRLVEKAATCGLFDVIGHFDIIKIFNIRPRTDVRVLAARALEAVKDCGLVLEINTNGRYKPVQEFYPEFKLVELGRNMEILFTLGSDAHEASVVGRDLKEACQWLHILGIKKITGFAGRNKQIFELQDV
ncbi:MAG: histidinol-phosphatase HisJ family protein [Peptococcaceae bacterium]|jgi:histidinol-phosphatase (PHP family)|nr:histidinol-phosphatase HisJ family protein [Peptococcaceae bacterium]